MWLEYRGEILVISGDYKAQPDSTYAPLEIVPCHHFITESTFALPIYQWQPAEQVIQQVNGWWATNAENGKASILYCYALGKAQRLLAGVDPSIGAILTQGAVECLNAAYRAAGVALPPTQYALAADKALYSRALIIAPVAARGTACLRFRLRLDAHTRGSAAACCRPWFYPVRSC